ncbi:MAG TPA: hypothetical protein VGK49_00315 [Ilumatobacteraceae bacterium]
MTNIFIPDTQRADGFRRDAALRRLARTGRGRRRNHQRASLPTTDLSDRFAISP